MATYEEKKAALESWLDLQVQAMQYGAMISDATWDDAVATNIARAWSVEMLRGYIVEAIAKFAIAKEGEALAMTAEQDSERLALAGFDVATVIQVIETLYSLYQRFFGNR